MTNDKEWLVEDRVFYVPGIVENEAFRAFCEIKPYNSFAEAEKRIPCAMTHFSCTLDEMAIICFRQHEDGEESCVEIISIHKMKALH